MKQSLNYTDLKLHEGNFTLKILDSHLHGRQLQPVSHHFRGFIQQLSTAAEYKATYNKVYQWETFNPKLKLTSLWSLVATYIAYNIMISLTPRLPSLSNIP